MRYPSPFQLQCRSVRAAIVCLFFVRFPRARFLSAQWRRSSPSLRLFVAAGWSSQWRACWLACVRRSFVCACSPVWVLVHWLAGDLVLSFLLWLAPHALFILFFAVVFFGGFILALYR